MQKHRFHSGFESQDIGHQKTIQDNQWTHKMTNVLQTFYLLVGVNVPQDFPESFVRSRIPCAVGATCINQRSEIYNTAYTCLCPPQVSNFACQ